MRIRWTRPARQDLARHHDYIAEDDPDAAERVEAAIAEAVERLADYPHRGRPGQRVGTRELVIADFPTYIVVYMSPKPKCALPASGMDGSAGAGIDALTGAKD